MRLVRDNCLREAVTVINSRAGGKASSILSVTIHGAEIK
jgi:hypothetical protein